MRYSRRELLDAADLPMLLWVDAELRFAFLAVGLAIAWFSRPELSGYIISILPHMLVATVLSLTINWIVLFIPSYFIKKYLLHQRRSWLWVAGILLVLTTAYFLVMGFIYSAGIKVKLTLFFLIPLYASVKLIRYQPEANKFPANI